MERFNRGDEQGLCISGHLFFTKAFALSFKVVRWPWIYAQNISPVARKNGWHSLLLDVTIRFFLCESCGWKVLIGQNIFACDQPLRSALLAMAGTLGIVTDAHVPRAYGVDRTLNHCAPTSSERD